MKIAILGTRGIPNAFGGFEQCAEKTALYFVRKGHDVTVYNPTDHSYKENVWNDITIKRIHSNEKNYTSFNPFILDYLSLKDAVEKDLDIILELGYSPCSLFYYMKNRTRAKIITNMAGLEWRRSKWSMLAREIIKYCEKIAVNKSDALIADNYGIKDYLLNKYAKDSYYIPYGADLYLFPNSAYLTDYLLQRHGYYMLVARFQPDNNIETILDGFLLSASKDIFLVVGNHLNKYGKYLHAKYRKYQNIRFAGGIYNYDILCSLRWYSKIYFHGHSCGGTNPSLLEAMASNAYIAAHDNVFNRYVLGDKGLYFRNAQDISEIINHYSSKNRDNMILRNRRAIQDYYDWDKVSEMYLDVFREVMKDNYTHIVADGI